MASKYNKYAIRRDALISPWGVGAIVPFPHDESLMVAGLDFWFDNNHSFDDPEFIIEDARLSKRLDGKVFVMPPDFRDSKQDFSHSNMKIPAVRFPRWHYCPVCGNMEKIGAAEQRPRCSGEMRKSNGRETYCYKNRAHPNKLPYLVPERFIAVCPNGHIEDFPIMEWVHRKSGKPIQDSCKLIRSTGGSSSSLAGVRYTCTCGATANMSGAFEKDALEKKISYTCTGSKPWLGEEKDDCGQSLFVLQRGASNVWFADIMSSVYIPNFPKKVSQTTKDCVSKGCKRFMSSRTECHPDEVAIKQFVAACMVVDDDIDYEFAVSEIIAALKKNEAEDTPQTEDDYRKQEFDVLTKTCGTTDEELYVKNYPISQYKGLNYLKSISLVHKLRETRVFKGFRRITPNADNPLARISLKDLPWLPAVKNCGEGIMFEFDYDLLQIWAKQDKVIERVDKIENNLKRCKRLSNEMLNPVYILLHTVAHCIINALSAESGYSNASIRERIYCPKYIYPDMPRMTGFLIYTASGDSEGSLGGLVRQGVSGRIEDVFLRAISNARWCAADPVCILSDGQGQNGCNLAACHNCTLLPETSCENKNQLLDRGLLIGTLDDYYIGFFNAYEKQ